MTLQAPQPRLILASGSATRAALLTSAGLAFTPMKPAIDEAAIKYDAQLQGASPDEAALLLADLKAQRIARTNPDDVVIGCDQLLVCEDRWFDKPASLAEARTHLQALRGRTHTLVTAILCRRNGQRIWHHIARPHLTMRDFSNAFLDAYLALEGNTVLSSVGAYRLEGLGAHLFDSLQGEHAAVLGLPLLPLLGFLRQHGVVMA